MRLFTLTTAIISVCILPSPAGAFVPSPVGGKPGLFDVSAHLTLERGLIEPNENSDSWQDAKWNLYTLGLGYNFGKLGPFLDFFLRIEGTLYTSPAETNERTSVASDQCPGQVLSATQCEFYPKDTGGYANITAGFNVIHQRNYAIGIFLRGTVPIGVDLDKFSNPRIDYIAGGVNVGVQLKDWLSHESQIYLGSGPFGSQNATVALTQRFGFEWKRPSWTLGVKVGSYFDADLSERFDERYDSVYTAGFPDRRDRIRMMRFGVLTTPYVAISDRVAFEFTYLQKLFGYDAPATHVLSAGVRTSF